MIYDTLAYYYDALVKDDQATLAWVDWIMASSAPCSVLELACGSAEITQVLSQKGYQMTALDQSESMIQQAREKEKALSQQMVDF